MHRGKKKSRGKGCHRWEPLLVAHVDGELNERVAVSLSAHLADCAFCRDQEVHLRALSQQLASALAEESLSPEEEAALATVRLPSEPPRRPPRRRPNVVTTTVRGLVGWARGATVAYEGR